VTWQLVMAANVAAALAYGAIAYLILSGLVSTGQLRGNHLGVATALIFVTGAGHHLILSVELLHGGQLRHGWDWHSAVWDLLTAAAGIYYLVLRRSRARVHGAQMFEDLKVRERQALEINDNIVQGLTVAKYALNIGAEDRSSQAIDDTLARARAIITDLLGEPGTAIEFGPGDLRRAAPAAVVARKEPPTS
jgi:hypothetical protein